MPAGQRGWFVIRPPYAYEPPILRSLGFTKEFIWLDNDVYPKDRAVLRERAILDRQWLVEVDLEANPQRLRAIVHDCLEC